MLSENEKLNILKLVLHEKEYQEYRTEVQKTDTKTLNDLLVVQEDKAKAELLTDNGE